MALERRPQTLISSSAYARLNSHASESLLNDTRANRRCNTHQWLRKISSGLDTSSGVIFVEAGKRYRFCLVSFLCNPDCAFSINEHVMVSSNCRPYCCSLLTVPPVRLSPKSLEVDSTNLCWSTLYLRPRCSPPTDNYWTHAFPNFGSTTVSTPPYFVTKTHS